MIAPNKTLSSTTPWLACRKPNPRAALRLFCFPYAGGGAATFHGWSSRLPEFVEVCPVQLPGRGGRLNESPYTRFENLVPALVNGLFPYFDKPFAFFGHSMGAILAFEISRQLRRENRMQPVQLFVSGSRAPQLPDDRPPMYDLSEPDLLEELRLLNGTPRELLEDPDSMQFMLPLLRADFELIDTYAYMPEAPLDVPISAFSGLQDGEVTREDAEGWRLQTSAAFSLSMLDGDHFFLHTGQSTLLQLIAHKLSQRVIAV